MNIKKKKYLLFIIIIVFLILPLFQEKTLLFNSNVLKGSFTKENFPELSIKDYYSGSFQKSFNNYLEQNIGFRSFFVRVNNQINYSIFKQTNAKDVLLGKEGYLFRKSGNFSYNGLDYVGDKTVNEKTKKLKFIVTELNKKDVKLFIVIAPNKRSFYEEFLTENSISKIKRKTNYIEYKKQLDKLEIPYLNLEEVFLKNKNHEYPLFSKCGIHWTQYGAAFALDTIVGYMENLSGISMPEIVFDKITPKKSWPPDVDIQNTMNLLFDLPEKQLYYPKLSYKTDTNTVKPNTIVIGDSYYHAIQWTGMPKGIFSKESAFWYYNKSGFTTDNKKFKVDEIDYEKAIFDADFIILFGTTTNFVRFSYGFVDKAYDLLIAKSKK
ncbi:MAG: hypothetical protein K8R41_01475 [Bacteroidales bacterium]|nr:hypothetical protein [Bacteroidales bacterium]